jgi:hypothetical protein
VARGSGFGCVCTESAAAGIPMRAAAERTAPTAASSATPTCTRLFTSSTSTRNTSLRVSSVSTCPAQPFSCAKSYAALRKTGSVGALAPRPWSRVSSCAR